MMVYYYTSLSSSGFSDISWVVEISHHGSIYTTDIGKCYKLKVFFFQKSIVQCLAVHHWWYPLNKWTKKKKSIWKPNTHVFSNLPEQKHVAGDTFQRPPQSRLPHPLCSREGFMLPWIFLTTENHGQTEGGWKCFSPGLHS